MAYTTDKLVQSVQRRSFAPTNQLTFQTDEILAIADEETKSQILPNIMAVREEFFVFYKDYSITAGLSAYDIPPRSIGMVVREVFIVDNNSAVTPLPRIEPEQIQSFAQGQPNQFYVKNNQIVLDRVPASTSQTLRVYFYLRPGDLVQTSEAAVISAINTGTNQLTVTTIPNSWVTGNSFDLIRQDGAHEYLTIDNVSTSVSSNVITLPSLPSTLRVGDYVSLSGESPVVQLPPDYQPVLAQVTAANILESMNQPGADRAVKKGQTLMAAAQKMITPRVVGADRVILHSWF